MKVKLIKDHQEYMLINDERFVIATTDESMLEVTDKMKLSKKNCDEIFGVVDLMKLAEENSHKYYDVKTTDWHCNYNGFFSGFQKAMELNKDKQFTEDDLRKAIRFGFNGAYGYLTGEKGTIEKQSDNYILSIQQPTEIKVEIEMECLDPNCDGINKKGVCIPGDKPKLDENGCLVLKKI